MKTPQEYQATIDGEHDKCLGCRRALKDPKSRKRGRGPVCQARYEKWQQNDSNQQK